MAIRVAIVGTGNCGRLALIQLIDDPRFELVAVGTSTESKVGLDAANWPGGRRHRRHRHAGHRCRDRRQTGLPGVLRDG